MAIVKERIAGNGARIRFFDDDYAGISAEEDACRRLQINMAVHPILVGYARRQNTTPEERSMNHEQHYPKEAQPHGGD